MNTIKPNANRPNEVIHYKDYVTIRRIKWKNHLKCEYICGMALENYIADKRMKTNILNPTIAIIEGELTFEKGRRNCVDIDSIMKQDREYLKEIEKLVREANVDIFVFEKSVSRKIVEKVRDAGCTLIMNVGNEELKRLA